MIDRLELEADEVVVVEIKTARIAHLPTRKDEGEWGVAWSDQIPQGYAVQTQHQIEVTNAVERERGRFCRRAIVFALIGNRGFVPFLTESLPEVQTFIVEELEQIARVNVALNIPLQPETADDWEIMADVVASKSGGKVTRLASDDEAAMVREYHALKKRIEADDLRRKELRARLFGAIGKGYKLTVDDDLSVTLTEGGEKEVDRPRAIVDDVTDLLPSMPADVRTQIEGIIRRHTKTTTTGRQLRVTEKRKP